MSDNIGSVQITVEGGPFRVRATEITLQDGEDYTDAQLNKALSEYTHVDRSWINDTLPKFPEARFVETVPIYETKSRNNFNYPAHTMEQFAKLAVGKASYLGHEDPRDRAVQTGYRKPVARHIAGRETTVQVEVDGVTENRKAAQFLLYISATREGHDHYLSVKEGTAGAMSITADLLGSWVDKNNPQKGFNTEQVVGVDSIDFVNNGTEGIPGAGVSAIVTEQFSDSSRSILNGPAGLLDAKGVKRMGDNVITLETLSQTAEGREIKTAIVNEASKPLTEKVTSLETEKTKLNDKISALEAEKTKLEDAAKESQEKIKKVEEQNAGLSKKLGVAVLEAYRSEVIEKHRSDIKESAEKDKKNPDYTILDMSIENTKSVEVSSFVVAEDDNDYSKSKLALKGAFDTEFGNLKKMAEKFGNPKGGVTNANESTHTRVTSTPSGGDDLMSEIFTDDALGKKTSD